MQEARLRSLVGDILELRPKSFMGVRESGQVMEMRLRRSAAELWRAFQERDQDEVELYARELEGDILAAQSLGRLSESEAIGFLDELHAATD